MPIHHSLRSALGFLALATVLAAAALVATAVPALALSLGPRYAGTQASCTFQAGCMSQSAVGPETNGNGCVVSSASTQELGLTGYGFTVPTGASITGIVVEVKGVRGTAISPTLRLLKAGSPAGTQKTATAIPVDSDGDCGDTVFRSFGTAVDLWGTTWSAEEVNNPGSAS